MELGEAKTRYDREREKRVRRDANAQYRPAEGDLADFAEDHLGGPRQPRDPVVRKVDVAIVGAGLGGLLAGAHLAMHGVGDVCLIERAADVGGTWYWNRYPGIACDVESYVYMPLLEETGYMPTERYASGPEIFAHCQRIARQYDLYDGALLETQATEARWDEESGRWQVATDRGDRISARFLLTAGGLFIRPKLPGIPGVTSFSGSSFHSSRWDYGYTGGSPTEPMDRLHDKRVALIGTGCTSIQILPKLAEAAQHVYLVQRTPSAVNVRANRPTDPAWVQGLEPGWQRRRVETFTHITTGTPVESDLIGDGWTELFLHNPDPFHVALPDAEQRDLELMDRVRARVDAVVAEPATAEALKPWYNLMCKRPTFHDEYLQTFNRANVTLVDTDGKGVDRVTAAGVVAGGVEYPVDCIVYASGFDLASPDNKRMGFEIYGRDGVSLAEAWAGGPATMFGLHARGFPNLFMFSLTQGGQAINFAHVLSALAEHSAWLIAKLLDRNATTVEPTEQAQQDWLQTLVDTTNPKAGDFLNACTPGYYNGEGQTQRSAAAARYLSYQGGTMPFIGILRDWREAGTMAGLDIA